jgi:hypothetical protein
MNDFINFLNDHPFVLGLLVGLLVAAAIWVRGLFQTLSSDRATAKLKDLLHTKLEVEARSHQALIEELNGLRTKNENLRVTVKGLQQKPDRADLRQLHVYDAAIRMLLSRSPGFAPAWQAVLEEAERKMAETETGISAFVRRVLSVRPVRALPEDTATGDESSQPE